LSHPRSGELTCSEWQVDDVLSAGESTQEERSLPKELIHQRPKIRSPLNHQRRAANDTKVDGVQLSRLLEL